MNLFIIPLSLLVQLFTTCSSQSDIIIHPEFEIRQSSIGIQSTLGTVYGAKSCGGRGKLIEVRYEGCQTTNTTCSFPADGTVRRGEVDFIPSNNIQQLRLKLKFGLKGFEQQIIYEKVLPNSTVMAGVQYTAIQHGGLTKEFKGNTITMQYILYGTESGRTELCMASEYQII